MLGFVDGFLVGTTEGSADGRANGCAEGFLDGRIEGCSDGWGVVSHIGTAPGSVDGTIDCVEVCESRNPFWFIFRPFEVNTI